MSKNSKAKRDSKKKKMPNQSRAHEIQGQIESHGEMQDENGRVLAQIGRRGGEWILAAGGQALAGGSGAAYVMVMFNHLAEIRQQDGGSVFNSYSTTFKAEAEREANEQGMSIAEYIEKAPAEIADPKDELVEADVAQPEGHQEPEIKL